MGTTWTTIKNPISWAAHKLRHQKSGADEINVEGLSGLLADEQHALATEIDYGLSFEGIVTTIDDSTHFKVSTLAGKGTGFFKPVAGAPYEIYVVEADGAAPEGEQTPVVAYTTADGTFQHAAFTGNLAVGDIVLIQHPVIASLGTKATDAATGAVTTTDYLMAYIKQLVTELQVVDALVDLIPTTVMRGTDSAMLAANGALEVTLTAIKGGGWATETLVAIKAAIDAISSSGIPLATDWKGSFNWDTSVYTNTEIDISALFSTTLDLTTRRKYTVFLDLTNVEADASFVSAYLAVKTKIDGTNYRAIDRKTVLDADIGTAAEPGIVISIPAVAENVQITMQMSTALGADATIYYAVVKEHLE